MPERGSAGSVRLLLTFAAVGLAATSAITGLFLAGLWAAGGIDTEGSFIDWSAVEAVGTVASAILALGTFTAVGLAAMEFERSREHARADAEHQHNLQQMERKRERRRYGPYLRIDIAFLEFRDATLSLPSGNRLLTAEELGVEEELTGVFGRLDPAPRSPSYSLGLWIQNMQRHPLGIADVVRVELLVRWQLPGDDEIWAATFSVAVQYVEPGSVTPVLMRRLRKDLVHFCIRVTGVVYQDIAPDGRDSSEQFLQEAHGAMMMRYDRDGGVTNERHIFRRTEDTSGPHSPASWRCRCEDHSASAPG